MRATFTDRRRGRISGGVESVENGLAHVRLVSGTVVEVPEAELRFAPNTSQIQRAMRARRKDKRDLHLVSSPVDDGEGQTHIVLGFSEAPSSDEVRHFVATQLPGHEIVDFDMNRDRVRVALVSDAAPVGIPQRTLVKPSGEMDTFVPRPAPVGPSEEEIPELDVPEPLTCSQCRLRFNSPYGRTKFTKCPRCNSTRVSSILNRSAVALPGKGATQWWMKNKHYRPREQGGGKKKAQTSSSAKDEEAEKAKQLTENDVVRLLRPVIQRGDVAQVLRNLEDYLTLQGADPQYMPPDTATPEEWLGQLARLSWLWVNYDSGIRVFIQQLQTLAQRQSQQKQKVPTTEPEAKSNQVQVDMNVGTVVQTLTSLYDQRWPTAVRLVDAIFQWAQQKAAQAKKPFEPGPGTQGRTRVVADALSRDWTDAADQNRVVAWRNDLLKLLKMSPQMQRDIHNQEEEQVRRL